MRDQFQAALIREITALLKEGKVLKGCFPQDGEEGIKLHVRNGKPADAVSTHSVFNAAKNITIGSAVALALSGNPASAQSTGDFQLPQEYTVIPSQDMRACIKNYDDGKTADDPDTRVTLRTSKAAKSNGVTCMRDIVSWDRNSATDEPRKLKVDAPDVCKFRFTSNHWFQAIIYPSDIPSHPRRIHRSTSGMPVNFITCQLDETIPCSL
jgi:hypothetical protein